MSENEFSGVGIASDGGGFTSGGMPRVLRHFLQITQKSRFMIEDIHILDDGNDVRLVTRIGTERITKRFFRLQRECFIGNNFSIRQFKITSEFQVFIVTNFNFRIIPNGLNIQFSGFCFFTEQIAIGINSMIQRNGKNLHFIVFKNLNAFFAIQFFENNVKSTSRLCMFQLVHNEVLNSFGAENIQRRFLAQKL